tara:strand:- start:1689 stop:3314 length:1626 start_codon:yes stop_codon:yes gene_type:complete
MTFDFYQLKNHILNDSLNDWFNIVHQKHNHYLPDQPNRFLIELDKQKTEYKQKLIDELCSKYAQYILKDQNQDQVQSSIQKNQKYIFMNSQLYHKDYNINVQPDLIIHRDIFKEIFDEIEDEDLPEYIILDILYNILHFTSDKNDILNQGNMYYSKCKIALATICITNNRYGYFIGKEYRHKNKTLEKKKTIGKYKIDQEYFDTIQDSIEWLKKLNRNYDNWVILPKPSVKELYPNMNQKCGQWITEKKKLADKIHEITLVWNISYKKRCILMDKGITQWSDPVLLSNIYPYQIKENQRELIQDKMIEINKQTELLITPRRIKDLDFISKIKDQKNSIILDIESVVSLDENESYFETIEGTTDKPRICILGTILNKEPYIFKDFTIKYLTNEEEKKIILYWVDYLYKQFQQTPIQVYHWGNAEKLYLQYMKGKYPDINYPQFNCIDLLVYFKQEPISIQGCFGYGLKEIVKQLYNFKLIENEWKDDIDGLNAMIQIIQTSEEAQLKRIPIKRYSIIKKIIYYNYMDCRVIVDILKLLQRMV